ncbi:HNH endonuclease [Sphingobacterium spiritivorum]|uniref:HNH endonuclease n=1 Tax=Sphingobacterium spiritivorum TaxID=258 RepID=UPI003DA616C8
MNWVKENRVQLEQSNYVLKADYSSNYWFGISQKKLDNYRALFGTNFNIILFGSEEDEGDFYILPFSVIQDLLIEDNLYLLKGKRQRWVGDIQNHILRIRNSNIVRNISDFFSLPQIEISSPVLQKDNLNDYAIENSKREIQVRVKQSVFRKKVLENFSYKCCLTDVTENDLLVASHIVPWASKIDTRLSPHNGLCLSTLYDSLFDKGYFTISDEYEVIITSKLERLSLQIQKWLNEIVGKKISTPAKYEISQLAIEYHRNTIFDKF